MRPGEPTDEEILAQLGAPEDSLKKQKARNARRQAQPRPTDEPTDEEIIAQLSGVGPKPSAPSPTSSYSLTDYAGENKAGPYSPRQQADDTRERAEANARLMEGGGPSDLMDGGTQAQRAYIQANQKRAGEERQETEAKDFSRFALGNVLGGVGASALQRLGVGPGVSGAVGGAVGNAVPTASTGAPAREVAGSAVLGGVLGGVSGPRAGQVARAPGTQAEIDAAVIQRYRAEHPDPVLNQMQGTHETYRLAKEANDAIEAAATARKLANKAMIDREKASYSMLDAEHPIPDTSQAIERIQGIRASSHGGQGAQLRSDPKLAEAQRQLTIGDEGTRMVPRDALQNVQEALNNDAYAMTTDPASQNALQGAAKVVSETVRANDPRRGPIEPNIGIALDRFGAEKDALGRLDDLRGPTSGREPKLARVGGGDQMADPAIHKAEAEVRDLQAAEPVGNKLIDRIRYNNTVGRRSLKMPYIGYSQTGNIERGLRQNWDNLGFKLNPPKIDASGNVAGRAARYTNPLILPLELQLLMNQQQEERR